MYWTLAIGRLYSKILLVAFSFIDCLNTYSSFPSIAAVHAVEERCHGLIRRPCLHQEVSYQFTFAFEARVHLRCPRLLQHMFSDIVSS